jgi:hypothetical protein
MVRGGCIEGKAEKSFEGQPIVNLVFQFGIGVDPEPLFQQQAFEQ